MIEPGCSRWGNATNAEINQLIDKRTPMNTKINKESQWNQFMAFCASEDFELNQNTTTAEIASILKSYACNMRRKDGQEYKESVIKTLWNSAAKTIQEKFFDEYNIKFNPFADIEFKDARAARDCKRKMLQGIQDKRKVSAVAFTAEEYRKMQKVWDENTPEGLQKKFFNVVAKELAWRGNEGVFATIYHFNQETDNFGKLTNRIEYNPMFNKTNQGGGKSCCDSKWLVPNLVHLDVCPVRLFLKLMEKRPKNVTTDKLFLTPNPSWRLSGSTKWYKNIPVGINTFSKWAKETAHKVGIDTSSKKVTNHSFRSTAVTHLANADIQEQQVMKITGHSNSKSLKPYLNMQTTRHAEIINKMRGIETEKSANTLAVSQTKSDNSQIVYQNCTFNVQNMYCNN